MEIKVTGRKMPVTDALRDYAVEKVGNAINVMQAKPTDCEVVLLFEQNPANPRPAVCEVTIFMKGHIVRVEEAEEDMYAAIDVAAAKVLRQLRKYKTKVVDRKIRATETVREVSANEEMNIPELMEELAAEDEEIVRVKEVNFTPLTEEEALIQIDLLGHDFFGYIDRDTNVFSILYRRADGGYGLLKQAE